MKILIQTIVMTLILAITPSAEASWGSARDIFDTFVAWLRSLHNTVTTTTTTHAAPELDVSIAPLAMLLLVGIVLAGYEKRRRNNLN